MFRSLMQKIFSLRRVWLLLLFPVGLLLYQLAIWFPDFAEWYARNPYRWLSKAVNFLTGLFPFSLAEILLYLLLCGILVWLVVGIVRLVK